jgi:hypothetical protein
VVVRFSDAELVVVRERAGLAGLAVGAWIGQTAIEAAERGTSTSAGLPDLLRLHADVVLIAHLSGADVAVSESVGHLLARLDAAIDLAVSAIERGAR